MPKGLNWSNSATGEEHRADSCALRFAWGKQRSLLPSPDDMPLSVLARTGSPTTPSCRLLQQDCWGIAFLEEQVGWPLWEVLPTVRTEAAQVITSGKPGLVSSVGIFLFTSVKLSKLSPARDYTKAWSSGPSTQEVSLKHPAHMYQWALDCHC